LSKYSGTIAEGSKQRLLRQIVSELGLVSMRYVELRSVDNLITVIFRPPTIDRHGNLIHETIATWAKIISREAIQIARENNIDLSIADEADDRLYPCLKPYYQTVISLLSEENVDVETIAPIDRVHFFVTQGTKAIGNTLYFRQSKLSWLLGNEERDTEQNEVEEAGEVETTGSFVLDVVGRVLVFLQKGQAMDLLMSLSPEEALKVCGYAGSILAEAYKDDKDTVEQPIVNYAIERDAIEELREKGLNLPDFAE
jgi:hypothetical protein